MTRRLPKSLATSATGASPRRATATTSSRNSLGWALGMVYILPAGPHGPTHWMSPIHAAVPFSEIRGGAFRHFRVFVSPVCLRVRGISLDGRCRDSHHPFGSDEFSLEAWSLRHSVSHQHHGTRVPGLDGQGPQGLSTSLCRADRVAAVRLSVTIGGRHE